jgi:hypothetical protein
MCPLICLVLTETTRPLRPDLGEAKPKEAPLVGDAPVCRRAIVDLPNASARAPSLSAEVAA